MGQTADEVRREIERTRSEMSETLDAIGDRVSPRRMVERRTDRVRDGFRSVKETVMGTADDATTRIGDAAGSAGGAVTGAVGSGASAVGSGVSSAADAVGSGVAAVGSGVSAVGSGVSTAAGAVAGAVTEAPEMARRQAQGNPLAAGIVAFGGGLLLASLLPKTRVEQQGAQQVITKLEPVKEQAKQAGQEIGQQLADTAMEGMDSLGERVTEATEQVKEQATSVSEQVKDQASTAAEQVTDQASTAAETIKSGGTVDPAPTQQFSSPGTIPTPPPPPMPPTPGTPQQF